MLTKQLCNKYYQLCNFDTNLASWGKRGKLTDEEIVGGEGKLSDEEIVTNSIVFLIAGNETTANTLAFTSYLLALHPEIQEKLQAKIDEYFESKPVSQSLMDSRHS